MSAWLVGLGLGAGYLVNRNFAEGGTLREAIARSQTRLANHERVAQQARAPHNGFVPATGGVTSKMIRDAHIAGQESSKYNDLNPKLGVCEQEQLVAGGEKLREEEMMARMFSAGGSPPPDSVQNVQGIYR